MKKTLMSVLALSVISNSVYAVGPYSTGCSGCKIDKLYLTKNKIYIGTNYDEKKIGNCSAVSGVYMTLEKSHPLFKEIYATLLSAKRADVPVLFRTESGNGCRIYYIVLDK